MIKGLFARANRYIVRRLDKQQRALSRLAKMPRYSAGTFAWEDKELHFPDANSFRFMLSEIFKEQIYKFESGNPAPLIIDCGANIGMSVIYFKQLFPASEIIAFEPEKKIFGYLQRNTDTLGLKGVQLVNKAVWKEKTTLQFSSEGADGSRISSIGNIEGEKPVYNVEAVKLSDYIRRDVELLKLDIEGAELEVLKEVEPKLGLVKRMFIEYHAPAEGAQELDTLLSILKRNNFRYYIDSSFRMRSSPFVDKEIFLSFSFFLNIYAERN